MNGQWVRPSTCNGGGCAEVRAVVGRVEVRDSNRPAEVAWFRPVDFAALIEAAKRGEYDHLGGAQ
jgi:hypothetical protein